MNRERRKAVEKAARQDQARWKAKHRALKNFYAMAKRMLRPHNDLGTHPYFKDCAAMDRACTMPSDWSLADRPLIQPYADIRSVFVDVGRAMRRQLEKGDP